MFGGAQSFDQDLGWCLGESVDVEYAFANTTCASTNCGVSQACRKRSKNKSAKEARKERNGAIIIASVLFAGLLLLGCALGSYRRRQKQLELERSEIVQEQVTAARDQIQEFQGSFDESARTKDFKPGTNAQRHRLHRIQHSRRASSRLADLTSMVRASFRRVNVVSETDSEKEQPAAARQQLSWRASAPDYGTI